MFFPRLYDTRSQPSTGGNPGRCPGLLPPGIRADGPNRVS